MAQGRNTGLPSNLADRSLKMLLPAGVIASFDFLSFTHPVNYFEVQPFAKARIVDLRLSIPETPETIRTESAMHPVPVQSREHPAESTGARFWRRHEVR